MFFKGIFSVPSVSRRYGAVLVSVLAVAAAYASGSPSVIVEPVVEDLGVIHDTKYDRVTKTEVQNNGPTTIEIAEIKASCGCTELKADKNIIPPGDKAVIESTINLRAKRGPFSIMLAVKLSSGQVLGQRIIGHVTRSVTISPSVTEMAVADVADQVASLSVYMDSKLEWRLRQITSTNPAIEVTAVPVSKAEEAELEGGKKGGLMQRSDWNVTVKRDILNGKPELKEEVVFSFEEGVSGKTQVVRHPVIVRSQGRFETLPKTPELRLTANAKGSVTFLLRDKRSAEKSDVYVEMGNDDIVSSIENIEAGVYKITLTWDAASLAKTQEVQVVIRDRSTADSMQLELPVRRL